MKICTYIYTLLGGAADTAAAAFVINKLCAMGPPNFIRKLEAAAQKSDKKNKKFGQNKWPEFGKNKWPNLKIPDEFIGKVSERKKKIAATFSAHNKKNFF
jgi:hypothetical protein